jgi:hypothetical protein
LEVKPRDAFSPDRRSNRDGVQSICKVCRKERERAWRQANADEVARRARHYFLANKERASAARRRWKREHPERVRAYALKKRYGMTPDEHAALFAAQGGQCAICGTTKQGKKGFHTDHNHATGVVRGLLCGGCNIALGYLERPGFLDAALKYLESHRADFQTRVA